MIVLSHEPETMVVPSGEKATDTTDWLCARLFFALSSKDSMPQAQKRSGLG